MSFLDFAVTKIDAGKDIKNLPTPTSNEILTNVLGTVYWTAGVVAVIIIIIAGIFYATSDGDASKVKRAKDAIVYALAGLVIVLMAFLMTQFIIGRF